MNYAKTTEQKRLAGNPGKRPIAAYEDTIALPACAATPETPEHLAEAGAEAWGRLWTVGSGWISPATDVNLVLRYCEALDIYEEFQKSIREYGAMYITEDLEPKVNPAVRQIDAYSKTLSSMERQLGLTPVARAALGVAEIKKQTALEKFLDNTNRPKAAPKPADPVEVDSEEDWYTDED